MFTGIIDHCGEIVAIDYMSKGRRLTLQSTFNNLVLGESIAVDGVCLTVTDIQQDLFCCDVSPETIALTTMAAYEKGTRVNLERSLAIGDRMGGHYVTGHVDQTAKVVAIIQHDDYFQVQLGGFSYEQAAYLIPKGSVTVNGVSLTINTVSNLSQPLVNVMLIPHTLAITNLLTLQLGCDVNIEFDYYAKIIAHQLALQTQSQKVTHDS